jgi:hypothetical protein
MLGTDDGIPVSPATARRAVGLGLSDRDVVELLAAFAPHLSDAVCDADPAGKSVATDEQPPAVTRSELLMLPVAVLVLLMAFGGTIVCLAAHLMLFGRS